MKDSEIPPEVLLRRYLELSEQDVANYFGDDLRYSIPCVACGRSGIAYQFEKHGFTFGLYQEYGTLFQTPGPAQSSFEAFYRDSVSSNYWANLFFPAVDEARREKIFGPRVDCLAQLCEAQGLAVNRLIDVGIGYSIFLDEWRKRAPETQLFGIEPSAALAEEFRAKSFEVAGYIVGQVSGQYVEFADLVVCFEVLEHVHEPLAFVKSLARLARPGGFVFVSTLCIDGFDLQTLWNKLNQISPPHHINLLSVGGFEKLFIRVELVDVTKTSSGKLDMDIVRNALFLAPDLLHGKRFLQYLISDDPKATAFKNYLSGNRLSPHVRVLSKVPVCNRS